ncbi:BTAD domain-containing putative transcriptional regulator [Aquisalimonas sp.]|uniref:BTAD domain-containing putative transcriptional regulator n=1 Tax=Aquisalimonas sp. TaxID=1872621 RepID=UPI0025C67771|nr:BTAD domain-containing putative transcriptional regulator [Aquisalimonas sp.]
MPQLIQVHARRRLYDRLEAAPERQFVWVEGPAGAGKTTLVAAYLRAAKHPVLWYQVDAGDTDLATFFYYLGLAGDALSGRAKHPLPQLTMEHLAGVGTFAQRYFEELDRRLPASTTLVFDGLHELDPDDPLHITLCAGIERLTPRRRVLLISRTPPPPAYARLSASRTLARLEWDMLRLTEEEAEGIASLRAHATSTPIKQLHQKTDGWVAGLILLLECGETTTEGVSFDETSPQTLFDYFAAEVFTRRNPAIKAFLMRTALFQSFTVAMAERLAGEPEAGAILADFVRQHYFTEKRAEGAAIYQYHPLFREFLLHQAHATWGPGELARYRHRAAAVLEQANQPEHALALYMDSGDTDAATRLLISRASQLVTAGRLTTLNAAIARLPAARVHTEPWLLYWRGIARSPFDPVAARESLARAFAQFHSQDDVAGAFLAWSGVVDTFIYAWDNFTPLDQWIDTLESLLARHPEFPSPEIATRVTFSMFNALMYRQPWHPQISLWEERLRTIMLQSEDPSVRVMVGQTLLFYYSWWSGDLAKGAVVSKAVRPEVGSCSVAPLTQIVWYAVEANYLWVTGSAKASVQAVENGLAVAEDNAIHVWDFMLNAQGVWGSLTRNDMVRAAGYLRGMATSFRPSQAMNATLYHDTTSTEALRRGDVPIALEHGRIAMMLADKTGMAFAQAMVRISTARALMESGDFAAASVTLEQAAAISRRMKSSYAEFLCAFAKARLERLKGDEAAIVVALKGALALGREYGFVNHMWLGHEALAQLCATALQHGIETAYVQDLIRRRGLAPDEADLGMEHWPREIKIYTLGRFIVYKRDKPWRCNGKTPRKPLELLKAMVALGSRDVSDTKLIEHLWPDAEGDHAQHALEMTLSRLRKLLGSPKAVLSQGRTLSLNGHYVWVDVWTLEQALQKLEAISRAGTGNETSTTHLAEQAAALYQGAFLAQDSDLPWAITLRERLRTRLLRQLRMVWLSWERAGRWEQAADGYQRGLEIDNRVEEFYQRLMLCYRALGRPAEALAVYQRCRQTLHLILGIAPSPKTEAIAQALRVSQSTDPGAT